ncbi:hypothetical protein [Tardiphaga sp. 367_B4_N1_1]|uniref:hypothetical protein n=1 Tax=Tardiphaga sp. 367_B4_N1_1 TaxID=3240777 RepID=UPI003F2423D3
MEKPHITAAPGLAWRPRKNGWAAVWLCRQDIRELKFEPATHQIGVFESELTEADLVLIRKECERLQEEMYRFVENRPKVFGGRYRDLINSYQTDPDSDYQRMRPSSRSSADSLLRRISKNKFADLKLRDIGLRDLRHLYNDFRWPDGEDGREMISTAHDVISMVRMTFSYGTKFEIEKASRDRLSECARIRSILREERFENAKPNEESMTLVQCEGIVANAIADGFPSIALAQTMQWALRARQKDILGEWVHEKERGISVIPHADGLKWLRGARWEEISDTMRLSHPISKSRTGKVLERDLNQYPMLMAELMKVPPEKRTGPIVICEMTGLPWKTSTFRKFWRAIATKAGVPATVMNMHSRAGGITETIEATNGNLEAARKEAEHSNISTTVIYSRRKLQSNNDTAVIVADFRAKNRA